VLRVACQLLGVPFTEPGYYLACYSDR